MATSLTSALPCPQSRASILNENIQAFTAKLRSDKAIDSKLTLIKSFSIKELPALTDKQLQALDALLNRPIDVRDKEGKFLFRVSINQLRAKIEEIVGKIHGLKITDIELVGSGAIHVLQADPDYFGILANSWREEKGAPFPQPFVVSPNDLDVRFYIEGANEKARYVLSNLLIDYYGELAKQQSAELMAQKVTDAYNQVNKGPRDVPDITAQVIKDSIFDKLANPNEPGNGNRYAIHSFAGVELMLIENLARDHMFSADAPHVSLKAAPTVSPDNPKTRQGLADRLTGVYRCDQDTICAIDFMKASSYMLQGLDGVSAEDEKKLVDEFISKLEDEEERLLFQNFIKEHLKGDPLKRILFLYNLSLAMHRQGQGKNQKKVLDILKVNLNQQLDEGIDGVLQALLFSSKTPIEDVEALLISLATISFKKKGIANRQAEFILRTDLEEHVLKLVLERECNPYYIECKYCPEQSLQKTGDNILNSSEFAEVFHKLYKVILGSEVTTELELAMLARELHACNNSPKLERRLWNRALATSCLHDARSRIIREAQDCKIFEKIESGEEAIWNEAPHESKLASLPALIASGQARFVWNAAQNDRQLLIALCDVVLAAKETTIDLAWHMTQVLAELPGVLETLRLEGHGLMIFQLLELRRQRSIPLKATFKLLRCRFAGFHAVLAQETLSKDVLERLQGFVFRLKDISAAIAPENQGIFTLEAANLFHGLLKHKLYALLKEDVIWKAAPLESKRKILPALFASEHSSFLWDAAEQDKELLIPLCEYVLASVEGAKDLAWHMTQVLKNLDHLDPATDIRRGYKLATSLVEKNPEMKALACQWMEKYVARSPQSGQTSWAVDVLDGLSKIPNSERLPRSLEESLIAQLPGVLETLRLEGQGMMIFNLLGECRRHEIPLKSTFKLLQCSFAGFHALLAIETLPNDVSGRLQRFVFRLKEAQITPERRDSYNKEVEVLFRGLLKHKQYALVKEMLKAAIAFPDHHNTLRKILLEHAQECLAKKDVQHVHWILIQNDWGFSPSLDSGFKDVACSVLEIYLSPLRVLEFFELYNLFPRLSPESWVLCMQQAGSCDAARRGDLWNIWVRAAFNRQMWQDKTQQHLQAWIHASELISEGSDRRVVTCLDEGKIFEELCKDPKGKTIIDNIMKSLIVLDYRYVRNEAIVKAIKSIRNLYSSDCVPFDQWLIGLYLFIGKKWLSEAVVRLSALVTSQATEKQRTEQEPLFIKAIEASSSLSRLQEPQLFAKLKALYDGAISLWTPHWPGFINHLAFSQDPLHKEIVLQQVQHVLSNPQEAKVLDRKALDAALTGYMQATVSSENLEKIRVLLTSSEFSRDEQFHGAASVWLRHMSPEIYRLGTKSEGIGKTVTSPFARFVENTLLKLPFSVLLDLQFQSDIRRIFCDMSTVKHKALHEYYMKFMDALVLWNSNNRTYVNTHTSDDFTYQSLVTSDRALRLEPPVYQTKTHNSTYGASTLEITTFVKPLVRDLMLHYESNRVSDSRMSNLAQGYLLDLIKALMDTLYICQQVDKAEMIDLIDRFVYLIKPNETTFFEHHLMKSVYAFLNNVCNRKYYFEGNVPKLAEYIFYIGGCLEATSILTINAYKLPPKLLEIILRQCLTRLKEDPLPESRLYAIRVFKESTRLVIKDFATTVDLFEFLRPIYQEQPYSLINGKPAIALISNPELYFPNVELSPSQRQLGARFAYTVLSVLSEVRQKHVGAKINEKPIGFYILKWVEHMLPVMFDSYDRAFMNQLEQLVDIISKDMGPEDEEWSSWMNMIITVFVAANIVHTHECHVNRTLMIHKLLEKMVAKKDGRYQTFILSFYLNMILNKADEQTGQLFNEINNLLMRSGIDVTLENSHFELIRP